MISFISIYSAVYHCVNFCFGVVFCLKRIVVLNCQKRKFNLKMNIMKKLILSISLVLFMSVSFVSAKETSPKKNYVRVSKELSRLLSPTSDVGELESEKVVKVKIRINSNNEIVVLQTNSINMELNDYIKNNLNYKMLNSTELKVDQDYVFDVKFKS